MNCEFVKITKEDWLKKFVTSIHCDKSVEDWTR